jgi:predicted ribosome quality control (RQC) complex YloA/Tae2 family protein
MLIELDITKTVEENAAMYFEEAKQAKRKIEGAKKALEESRKKLADLDTKIESDIKKKQKKVRKKEWYEKFRWFLTSSGFLFIAGRDATTNEILVKKHMDEKDLVFHSEMAGSPFGILKTEGKEPDKKDIEECAQFIACYCKVWKTSMTMADVFYVRPDQVTKEAPAGEYISKGSFMIYGKKTIVSVPLKLFLGKMEDGKIMSGPKSAVETHCGSSVEVFQGSQKLSEIAKKVRHKLDADDLDDIVKVLPVGSALR